MSILAALLPHEHDREQLRAIAVSAQIVWSDSWSELGRIVRSQPVTAVIADLHAERRRDGVLRVLRLHERFPLTPILVWGEPDSRELLRLGKAGAQDVLFAADREDAALAGEVLESTQGQRLASILAQQLAQQPVQEARAVVLHAADGVAGGIQVPELAAAFGMSVSTLERRCERWQLPTPGRILLWLRVLQGLRWLLEPGRSVESVAAQLGYSSGAAFRRAIKATVGGRPTPLRNADGFNRGLALFNAEFGVAKGGA
jgi:AraC-like DNA-binding protein